jgi:hypothetical protein
MCELPTCRSWLQYALIHSLVLQYAGSCIIFFFRSGVECQADCRIPLPIRLLDCKLSCRRTGAEFPHLILRSPSTEPGACLAKLVQLASSLRTSCLWCCGGGVGRSSSCLPPSSSWLSGWRLAPGELEQPRDFIPTAILDLCPVSVLCYPG